jgi:hypothetical protein
MVHVLGEQGVRVVEPVDRLLRIASFGLVGLSMRRSKKAVPATTA